MTWGGRLAGLLREPLVHFMVAGGLVFAVLSGRPPDPGERRIVVDERVGLRLADRFMQSYRRAPTPDEIDGMIRDHVRGEVYYREALRLGLDRGDEVVVRRMRNKMLALATAEAEAREPSEAELQVLLSANPQRYAGGMLTDFEQVFMGAESPENRASAAAAARQLNASGAVSGVGQPAPMPRRFERASPAALTAQFGEGFARDIGRVGTGSWAVLVSGLGLHLVKVERRSSPATVTVAAVRQQLVNDWRAAAVEAAEEENYRELLEGYEVVIAKPGS